MFFRCRYTILLEQHVYNSNTRAMTHEQVILVDEHDTQIGVLEKLAAHTQGRLHRAFSIFVFHPDGRLMLQKRAKTKYHSGGLWSNTCCSHPQPGESVVAAAHRRLREEMGFDCELTNIHAFVYRIAFPNGLIEQEYDHVLVGVSDKTPVLNIKEADDWRWIEHTSLRTELKEHPQHYTYWLRVAYGDVLKKMRHHATL